MGHLHKQSTAQTTINNTLQHGPVYVTGDVKLTSWLRITFAIRLRVPTRRSSRALGACWWKFATSTTSRRIRRYETRFVPRWFPWRRKQDHTISWLNAKVPLKRFLPAKGVLVMSHSDLQLPPSSSQLDNHPQSHVNTQILRVRVS